MTNSSIHPKNFLSIKNTIEITLGRTQKNCLRFFLYREEQALT
jgi:hypothetical protein